MVSSSYRPLFSEKSTESVENFYSMIFMSLLKRTAFKSSKLNRNLVN